MVLIYITKIAAINVAKNGILELLLIGGYFILDDEWNFLLQYMGVEGRKGLDIHTKILKLKLSRWLPSCFQVAL